MAREYAVPLDFLFEAADYYSQWDGFGDAVNAAVTLPQGVSLTDFLNCARCYADEPDFVLDESGFRQSLYENVVKPMFDTEDLVQSRPYVTRLYTTMSADEMTMDPLFDLNGELGDVDNQHTADRVINCEDDSFRVELASGDIVFGSEAGVWPVLEDQPAARRIMQLTTQGNGELVQDNRDTIRGILMSAAPAGQDDRFPPLGDDGGPGDDGARLTGNDGGLCSAAGSGERATGFGLVALALVPLLRRRRRA
jgi:hypothetical protein